MAFLKIKFRNVNIRCLRQRRIRSIIVASISETKQEIGKLRKDVILMLNENIRTLRRSKGLSQEELAARLNVVRQTVSKWENGLSVPDSDMLISLSEVLEIPVGTLLGETVVEHEADDMKVICQKLETINLQLAQRKIMQRKILHWLLISFCAVIAVIFAIVVALGSPYLNWNHNDPETAVFIAAFHAFEYLFVRTAPIAFSAGLIGIFLTGNKS